MVMVHKARVVVMVYHNTGVVVVMVQKTVFVLMMVYSAGCGGNVDTQCRVW